MNDLKHGQGKMEFQNGDMYQGAWENDTKNGFGRYQHATSETYEGMFLRDRR